MTSVRTTGCYIVSKDEKSGLWCVHLRGFPYVPVFGSFRKSKKSADAIARQRNTFL